MGSMEQEGAGQVPDRPARWISAIDRLKRIFLDRELAEMGLGGSTFMYLMILSRRDGLRQEDFCRELNLDKGCVARALAKLERRGYVRRREDPSDGRAHRVEITEAGRAVLPGLRGVLKSLNDTMLDGFADEQRRLAGDMLETISGNLARRLGRK